MSEQRCEQCGRVGTRGFKVIPQREIPPHLGQGTVGPYTVCASAKACRSRWPKAPVDDE